MKNTLTLDGFLEKRGIKEEVESIAIKEFFALQLESEMKKQHLRKTEMAQKMGASRATLDRVLDPNNGSLNLSTLIKAAEVLGKRVELKLL